MRITILGIALASITGLRIDDSGRGIIEYLDENGKTQEKGVPQNAVPMLLRCEVEMNIHEESSKERERMFKTTLEHSEKSSEATRASLQQAAQAFSGLMQEMVEGDESDEDPSLNLNLSDPKDIPASPNK